MSTISCIAVSITNENRWSVHGGYHLWLGKCHLCWYSEAYQSGQGSSMVTAAGTIDSNLTPDGLLSYMVAGRHLVFRIFTTRCCATIYGNKPSGGYVPSGVKGGVWLNFENRPRLLSFDTKIGPHKTNFFLWQIWPCATLDDLEMGKSSIFRGLPVSFAWKKYLEFFNQTFFTHCVGVWLRSNFDRILNFYVP